MAKKKFIQYTNILFTIYIASLLACCIFFYYRIMVLEDLFHMVSHTIDVKLKLEKTLADIRDAETAQRGYLLTQDSLFLEHYNEAHTGTFQTIKEINALTEEHSVQKKNAIQLQSLAEQRFQSLQNTLRRQAEATDKTIKTEHLLNGRKVMTEIRTLVYQMTSLENEVLKDKEKQKNIAIQLTPIYALGIIIFSLLIVIGCYIILARYNYRQADI